MRVLIVDDSVIVRERLAMMLAEIDHLEVAGEAADAVTAIELEARLKPDVVILDISLGDGPSGIYALQQIKSCASSPLVIMFTSYPYDQYRRKCFESGADFFFDKTSDTKELFDVLSKAAHNIATNRIEPV